MKSCNELTTLVHILHVRTVKAIFFCQKVVNSDVKKRTSQVTSGYEGNNEEIPPKEQPLERVSPHFQQRLAEVTFFNFSD